MTYSAPAFSPNRFSARRPPTSPGERRNRSRFEFGHRRRCKRQHIQLTGPGHGWTTRPKPRSRNEAAISSGWRASASVVNFALLRVPCQTITRPAPRNWRHKPRASLCGCQHCKPVRQAFDGELRAGPRLHQRRPSLVSACAARRRSVLNVADRAGSMVVIANQCCFKHPFLRCPSGRFNNRNRALTAAGK